MNLSREAIDRQAEAEGVPFEDLRAAYLTHLTREKQTRQDARPFGGVDRAAKRNSWKGRLEVKGPYAGDGFAKPDGKGDGTGSTPAPPTEWTREQMAMLRVQFAGPDQEWKKFLGNLKRWVGRRLLASEVDRALKAGKDWRSLWPKAAPEAPETTLGPRPAQAGTPSSVFQAPAPVVKYATGDRGYWTGSRLGRTCPTRDRLQVAPKLWGRFAPVWK